jgi:hypothetical protein
VVVIAELESGGAGLRSGLVHFVRETLVVIRVAALLRKNIGHHHVLGAQVLDFVEGLLQCRTLER